MDLGTSLTAGHLPSHADWYAAGHLAPYIRERRLAGAAGAILEAAQPAGDMSDPPVADLVLIRTVSDGLRQDSDLGGGRFRASSPAGTLFLVPPGTATDIQVHNRHVVRVYGFPALRVRPQLEAARPEGDPFDFGRLHAGGFQDAFLLQLLDRLWEEAAQGDAAGRLFAEGALVALLGALVRLAGRPGREMRGGLADWQVRRAADYMDAHLDRDVGLPELAALVGLSPQHFCTAFRRSTGEPPHRWLTLRRMERAKALLADRRLGLTEIALAVGYGSQSAFGAAFRRVVGTAPRAWRRTQG